MQTRLDLIMSAVLLGGCALAGEGIDAPLSAATEEITAADTVDSLSPWAGEKQAPPPEKKPFKPATMHGDPTPYEAPRVKLSKAPKIDSEAVFDRVMSCYPARSTFKGLEISLTGRATTANVTSTLDDGNYTSGRNYVGIVATLPLYSDAEITRRRDREAGRRTDTASEIANFSEAIARRNQQIRLLSLYRALETRSAKRVEMGIVAASEQITFLEKVSKAHTAVIKAESDILESRLKLVARCSDNVASELNEWLKDVARARE